MSRPILVDTDVLIDFLRGHDEATGFVTANSEDILVSSIVVAELYAGARGGPQGAERVVLENLFGAVPGVLVHELAGGVATCTGPDSPFNKVAGLGFAGVIDRTVSRGWSERSRSAGRRCRPRSRASRTRRCARF